MRPADVAPLATIIQMAPVYVSFTVPQKDLPDIRQAIAADVVDLGCDFEASKVGATEADA